jgi:hypothetical protein
VSLPGDVADWHKADVLLAPLNVRFRHKSDMAVVLIAELLCRTTQPLAESGVVEVRSLTRGAVAKVL